MTEEIITAELQKHIKDHLHAVLIKHADKSTIGVPDTSVSFVGTTAWLEIKLIKHHVNSRIFMLSDIVEYLNPQHRTMIRLDHHAGNAWYVLFFYSHQHHWHTVLLRARDTLTSIQKGKGIIDLDKDGTPKKDFQAVLLLLERIKDERTKSSTPANL